MFHNLLSSTRTSSTEMVSQFLTRKKNQQLWRLYQSYQRFVWTKVSPSLMKEASINCSLSRVHKLMWKRPTGRGTEASLFTRLLQRGQSAATRSTKRRWKQRCSLRDSPWAHRCDKLTPPTLKEKDDQYLLPIKSETVGTRQPECSLKGALFGPLAVAKALHQIEKGKINEYS